MGVGDDTHAGYVLQRMPSKTPAVEPNCIADPSGLVPLVNQFTGYHGVRAIPPPPPGPAGRGGGAGRGPARRGSRGTDSPAG